MAHPRRNKLVIAGLLLFAAALCLVGFNVTQQLSASRHADEVTQRLEAELGQRDASDSSSSGAGKSLMKIDGDEYVGILEIPSLSLKLPINNDLSDAALNKTPCRYRGSIAGDDLVVAGHNYWRHFGCLSDLKQGDGISIKCEGGFVVRYKVVKVEVLAGDAVEEMGAGDWSLTLFTCTPDSASRVTVRCKRC